MENKYDVIIIGSGIGGMSAGFILSKLFGKKVLILERHFKLGGFTHIFKRKANYVWDVGVHYIGEMHNGSESRKMFDYLTGGKVKWQRMPEVYDKGVFPDFTFDFEAGEENLKSALIKQFPEERDALIRYFEDLNKVMKWSRKYQVMQAMPKLIGKLFSGYKYSGSEIPLQTTTSYLDKNFRDEKLKALLVTRYGDHGLPPAESSFLIHAVIMKHYMNGGYFPVGSSKTIADSMIPAIEENGSKALMNHEVKEITVKNGRVTGVKATEKKGTEYIEREYFADTVISNTGAEITYNRLLKGEQYNPIREKLEKIYKPVANVTLYVGLKQNPEEIGFTGANHWIYTGYDINALHNRANELLDGKVNMAFLSFPSMKNEKAPGFTAEIISFLDYEPFTKWAEQPWKNRDEDYQQLKEKISQALLNFVDERYPGFKEAVDYYELSTPLSTEFFTGNRGGNIYGIPATPERFRQDWIGYRTPVKNLYLAGTDSTAHGVTGAMMGGVLAAAVSQGILSSMPKIGKAVNKFSGLIKD